MLAVYYELWCTWEIYKAIKKLTLFRFPGTPSVFILMQFFAYVNNDNFIYVSMKFSYVVMFLSCCMLCCVSLISCCMLCFLR